MRSEFTGNIAAIRTIEDAIRATHKYTEGLGITKKEPLAQVGQFPSRAFSRCYEVYPDMVVNWDMLVSAAIDWLWADTTCINVRFWYDYRSDKASVRVIGGDESIRGLLQSIPGLLDALLATATDTEEVRRLTELSKKLTLASDEPEDEDGASPKIGLLGILLAHKRKTE